VRQLLNQHSYVVVAVVALAMLWLIIRRLHGMVRWVALAVAVVAIASVAAWFRTPTGDVRAISDLDGALDTGEPVLLEFYSNY
jgi:hypothetical protein